MEGGGDVDEGRLPLQLPVIVSFWRLPNELPNQKCLACSSGVAAGSATSAVHIAQWSAGRKYSG